MQISPSSAGFAVAPTEAPDRDQIMQAAQGFEALFLSELLKAGRAGLPGDSLTGSSAVTSAQEMLDSQLARTSAGAAGLGLAEAIARQFAPDAPGEAGLG